MHACFKLDIEQAHSQAFQRGGYLGGEAGITGESRNVGGGKFHPSSWMGLQGSRGPLKTLGNGEFGMVKR